MPPGRVHLLCHAAVVAASLTASACGPAGETPPPDTGPSCVSGCPEGLCAPGEWVPVCPGTYRRGGDLSSEVTLTRGFEILSTEVTQGEFEELMGYNPSLYSEEGGRDPCGPDCPVEWVTWHEAVQYCNALSERSGLEPCYVCTGAEEEAWCDLAPAYRTPYECEGFRLPTEAEWEYAARAGTTTATYAGDIEWGFGSCEPYPLMDEIAWYCTHTTHPVAELRPNPWGLYDVLGNVAEWCADHFCGSEDACELTRIVEGPITDPYFDVDYPGRIARGGGWIEEAEDCLAYSRWANAPSRRFVMVGLRPARTRLDIGAEAGE